MNSSNSLKLLIFCSILGACVSGAGLPALITAERGGFIPEGIEYDNINSRLLTGSLADGTIYEITSAGAVVPVVEDSALISSVGIEVDEPRNRLLVANSDRNSETGAAMLGVYDLNSGARLAMLDLAASIENRPADATHFANDVAVSARGVAYVTDTNMNIIYKVDNYYNASVLYDFGRESELRLNGIEFHPSGILLVAAMGTGELLRVPVDNPQRWSVVDLDTPAAGGDGIVWAADGTLAVISNNQSSVTKYQSTDNWHSATVAGVAVFEGQGTTGAVVGDDIYVVQPHFSDQDPPVILRATF